MSLARGIEMFLQPMLGGGGARRLILAYCANFNKQPDDISNEDLPQLGSFLREHLTVFVGKEQAEAIMKQLKPS